MFAYSNICMLVAKGLLRENWMTVWNDQHKYTLHISTMVGISLSIKMPVTCTEFKILSPLVYRYPLKSVPIYLLILSPYRFQSLHWTTVTSKDSISWFWFLVHVWSKYGLLAAFLSLFWRSALSFLRLEQLKC
jgi:hypothetical protein